MTHPNVTPPTPPPSKALPVTTLPNGQMSASATGTAATAPAAPVAQAEGFVNGLFDSIGSGTIFFSLIALGVIVLVGIGWVALANKSSTEEL